LDLDFSELCQWLWSRVLNLQLQEFVTFRNGVRMRKDGAKPGPSGMSRNEAFCDFQGWGGKDFLMPVDLAVIRHLKEALGGDELLAFTSTEFSVRAQAAYDSLHITKLTMQNAWYVFGAMLAIL
jgi:hypothetical protein